MKVKIYGYGWVGQSVGRLFPDAEIVDPNRRLDEPGFFSEVYGRNREKPTVAFICVPTPLKDGKLDTSIVERVIEEAQEDLIIVRSTVMPGTCDRLERRIPLYKAFKEIVYQPEYLGETVAHPLFDETRVPFMILGGTPENRRKAIELYQTVYNANIRIRQVTNYEAEIIKLSENRAIAFKVAQCQELFDVCDKAGVDYYTIREAVYGDDPRFSLAFSFVYPERRGFNSKCIPKDVYGWAAWAESLGYTPELTKAMLAVNEKYIQEQVTV